MASAGVITERVNATSIFLHGELTRLPQPDVALIFDPTLRLVDELASTLLVGDMPPEYAIYLTSLLLDTPTQLRNLAQIRKLDAGLMLRLQPLLEVPLKERLPLADIYHTITQRHPPKQAAVQPPPSPSPSPSPLSPLSPRPLLPPASPPSVEALELYRQRHHYEDLVRAARLVLNQQRMPMDSSLQERGRLKQNLNNCFANAALATLFLSSPALDFLLFPIPYEAAIFSEAARERGVVVDELLNPLFAPLLQELKSESERDVARRLFETCQKNFASKFYTTYIQPMRSAGHVVQANARDVGGLVRTEFKQYIDRFTAIMADLIVDRAAKEKVPRVVSHRLALQQAPDEVAALIVSKDFEERCGSTQDAVNYVNSLMGWLPIRPQLCTTMVKMELRDRLNGARELVHSQALAGDLTVQPLNVNVQTYDSRIAYRPDRAPYHLLYHMRQLFTVIDDVEHEQDVYSSAYHEDAIIRRMSVLASRPWVLIFSVKRYDAYSQYVQMPLVPPTSVSLEELTTQHPGAASSAADDEHQMILRSVRMKTLSPSDRYHLVSVLTFVPPAHYATYVKDYRSVWWYVDPLNEATPIAPVQVAEDVLFSYTGAARLRTMSPVTNGVLFVYEHSNWALGRGSPSASPSPSSSQSVQQQFATWPHWGLQASSQ